MTAKPETAAEVLAEMFKHAESAARVTPLDLARFADRIERALSAQGEAVAWAHPDGRVLSASEKAAMIANTDSPFPAIAARFDIPLVRASTHPAPARVTAYELSPSEANRLIDVHDAWIAEADSIGADWSGNAAKLEKLRAIAAALEADHG